MNPPSVDGERLWANIMALADITEPDRPWTRRSFTPTYRRGRAWLADRFAEAGLVVETDAAANLIGKLPCAESGLAPIVIGSHTDTVPSGGRFDGVLGVLAGLEVVTAMRDLAPDLQRPVWLVDFLAEEPSAFGLSCVGSGAIGGALTADHLRLTRDDGVALSSAIAEMGGDPARIGTARWRQGVAAYLEVHIEQGIVLESAGIDIGVVTDIFGIRRDRVQLSGQADHAGATPMHLRRDALVAAAGLIADLDRRARSISNDAQPIVATVGRIDVEPNAANAIPGIVDLVMEVRAGDTKLIDDLAGNALTQLHETAAAMGIATTSTTISSAPPVACATALQSTLTDAARACGLSSVELPSGAGHDGVFVAATGPVGMVFVPCLEGRSHCPEEWASKQACTNGANVMLKAAMDLAGATDGRS